MDYASFLEHLKFDSVAARARGGNGGVGAGVGAAAAAVAAQDAQRARAAWAKLQYFDPIVTLPEMEALYREIVDAFAASSSV